jgi:alpha-L-fucosidase 2
MRALFPVLGQAAQVLGIDDDVVEAAKAALPHLPELPLTLPGSDQLLTGTARNDAQAIITSSYMPGAITHNSENIGLEPVWPYGLIGDSGALHALGVQTFATRPNKAEADWSADPVQAARLGLGEEMRSTLAKITERYQFYPNGMAQLTDAPEFYVEQIGVLADALQSGLVQDYDGLIRVLPAWPREWTASGTVVVQHGDRVDVQVRDGRLTTLVLEAAHDGAVRMRNPWPGQLVRLTRGDGAAESPLHEQDGVLTIQVRKGASYLLLRGSGDKAALPFAPVSGQPATAPKQLGTRSIGLAR